MRLWILRHGEAHPQAVSDAERELTPHGRAEVLSSAAHLLGQPLHRIIASPYIRAQQTAELVHQVLGFDESIITVQWLTPDSDPRAVLSHLDRYSTENVLLVSHQPLVGSLVGGLVHGHYRSAEPMNTASLAELEGDFPLAGLMELRGVRHV